MQRTSANVRVVQDAMRSDALNPASTSLADALTRRDAPAAAALYAADSRLLTPAEQLVGPEQIEAYWQAGITLGLSSAVLKPTEIRIGDRVAVEAGRYELAFGAMPGRPTVVDRGTYLVLHRRDDEGAWRRVIDLFDVDPAQVPGAQLLEET